MCIFVQNMNITNNYIYICVYIYLLSSQLPSIRHFLPGSCQRATVNLTPDCIFNIQAIALFSCHEHTGCFTNIGDFKNPCGDTINSVSRPCGAWPYVPASLHWKQCNVYHAGLCAGALMSTAPWTMTHWNGKVVFLTTGCAGGCLYDNRQLDCLPSSLLNLTLKIKAQHHWSIVRGIHRWPWFPSQRPVMRLTFPYHDVIIHNVCATTLQWV